MPGDSGSSGGKSGGSAPSRTSTRAPSANLNRILPREIRTRATQRFQEAKEDRLDRSGDATFKGSRRNKQYNVGSQVESMRMSAAIRNGRT